MNPKAIDKAKIRVEASRNAVLDLSRAAVAEEMTEAWVRFLTYSQAVFEILEAGTKGFPGDKGWFDEIKHVRKTDPSLRYLHQARHAELHGIEVAAEILDWGHTLVYPPEMVEEFESILFMEDESTGEYSMAFKRFDGTIFIPGKKYNPPSLILKPVENRGVIYEPPKQNNITLHILEVAVVGQNYVEKILREAIELKLK